MALAIGVTNVKQNTLLRNTIPPSEAGKDKLLLFLM